MVSYLFPHRNAMKIMDLYKPEPADKCHSRFIRYWETRYSLKTHTVMRLHGYSFFDISRQSRPQETPASQEFAVFLCLPLRFLNCRCLSSVLDVTSWGRAAHSYLFSAFWPVVAFCNALCLLQRENEEWDIHSSVGRRTHAYKAAEN